MLYCNRIQREMRWKDAQGDLLNVRAILKSRTETDRPCFGVPAAGNRASSHLFVPFCAFRPHFSLRQGSIRRRTDRGKSCFLRSVFVCAAKDAAARICRKEARPYVTDPNYPSHFFLPGQL